MSKFKTPNKKNIFVRMTSFSLIFVLLFVLVSYLFRPVNNERIIINGFYAEDSNELDVVYIGGSVCFVSWAPLIAFHEQGIASYDYACNTIQADTLKYCIKDVLKTQSPNLLIIDARPFEYRDTEQPPSEVPIRNLSDSMSYSLNRAEMLADIVPTVLQEDSLEYIFDISKYHGLWKSLSKTSFDYMFNKKENESKGFCFIPKSTSMPVPSNKSSIKETLAPYDETNDILTDLLEFCKNENLNVLFVVAPYIEPDNHRMMYNFLSERIKSYGFDFVNFNEYYSQIGLDFSKDLYNSDHLNIFGAEKYTKYLAQYLTKNYNLPDRRNDPAYADWYDLLPKWDADVSSVKQKIEELINK